MVSFFIVCFCFLVSFALHILVHRYYRARLIPVFAVYAAGAALLYGFGRMGYISLPWSSGFFFVLLSCAAIFFYMTNPLGLEGPTSTIFASFQRKKQQTLADLTLLFIDTGLIAERIDDLIHNTLVQRRDGTFILTERGKILWRVMEAYKLIFHRTLTE